MWVTVAIEWSRLSCLFQLVRQGLFHSLSFGVAIGKSPNRLGLQSTSPRPAAILVHYSALIARKVHEDLHRYLSIPPTSFYLAVAICSPLLPHRYTTRSGVPCIAAILLNVCLESILLTTCRGARRKHSLELLQLGRQSSSIIATSGTHCSNTTSVFADAFSLTRILVDWSPNLLNLQLTDT